MNVVKICISMFGLDFILFLFQRKFRLWFRYKILTSLDNLWSQDTIFVFNKKEIAKEVIIRQSYERTNSIPQLSTLKSHSSILPTSRKQRFNWS